jgi:3D-(3,5/4)-trihydroxycyclohexane-1,2-dione acylhydrolase (decyclizing)
VAVGDLSFLMASQELVTAVQENLAFTVVVFDNHGGQSIRGLQRRSGFQDFSMEFTMDGSESYVPLDFVKIAEGLGATGVLARTADELEAALEKARRAKGPTVIHLPVDKENMMGGYDSWWDVPRPESWSKGDARQQLENYRKKKSEQVIR